MFCGTCGSNNLSDAQFCKNCGRPIEREKAYGPGFSQDENRTTVLTSEDSPEIFSQIQRKNTDNWMYEPAQYIPVDSGKSKKQAKVKSKSKKKLWVAISCVLLALVLTGGLGYLFRWKIIKAISPEKYVQLAIVRTLSLAEKEQASILNLSKYDGSVVSQVFSFEVDKMNIEGTVIYDPEKKESLLDLSVDDGMNSYEDNQLYISQDVIAVGMPDVVEDTDYLTMEVDSVAPEWEAPQFVEVFSVGKSVDEVIGGQKMHLDVMTYTYSEKEINDYFDDYLQTLTDTITNTDIQNPDYISGYDYFLEGLENLDVKDDVEVHLYIDKNDYIRKISIENFTVSGDNFDASGNLEVLFEGNSNPTDNISARVTSESGGGTYEISLARQENFDDGIYTEAIELEASGSEFSETFNISADVTWDKNKSSGDNLELQMNGGTENESVFATLTGSLSDANKEIAIDNASLVLTDEYGNEKNIDFETSIKSIEESSISIDTSDSIPLMEYKPFLNYMQLY